MGDFIEATQTAFDGLISKPKMTNKFLGRPPFRFLHDIITNTMKATGFPEGLYHGQELDSRAVKSKEAKIGWLTKLIDCVSRATHAQIRATPKTIVAGVEAEHTNELLQMIAAVAKRVQSGEMTMSQILGTNSGDSAPEMPETKEPEPVAAPSPPPPQPSGNTGIQLDMPADIDENDWVGRTQKSLGQLFERPRLLEKLLKRPPFRFLHDIVKAVIRSTGFPSEFLSEDDLNSQKVKDAKFKLQFLTKVIRIVSATVDEDLDVLIDAKKIVSGQEPENTNLLLFKLAVAATSGVSPDVIQRRLEERKATENERREALTEEKRRVEQALQDKMDAQAAEKEEQLRAEEQRQEKARKDAEKKKKDAAREQQRLQKKAEKEKAAASAKREEKMSRESSQQSIEPKNNRGGVKPVATLGVPSLALGKIDQANESQIEQRFTTDDMNASKPARPLTARRPPPKLKSQMIKETASEVKEEENNDGIIMDGETYEESNATVAREKQSDHVDLSGFGFDSRENVDERRNWGEVDRPTLDDVQGLDPERHGKLVRDILGSQNESQGITINTKLGGGTSKSSSLLTELDRLRELVQTLCQTSLPLGKCVDMVFEDVEQMNSELTKWKQEAETSRAKLQNEMKMTGNELKSLQQRLAETRQRVDDQQRLIREKRAQVMRNEKKINSAVDSRLIFV